MPSRNPKDIETTKRGEMMCPECWTRGLEEHPGYVDDYNTHQAKVIKATRCPNPDCKYNSRVPPQEIEKQYEKPSLIIRIIQGLFSGGDGEEDKQRKQVEDQGGPITKKRLLIGIVVIGMLGYGYISGGGTSNPIGETTNIQGEVVGVEGTEPISEVKITETNTGNTINTTQDGIFNLEIPQEKAVLSFEPPQNSALQPHSVVLSLTENKLQLHNVDSDVVSLDNSGNLSFKMPLEEQVSYNRSVTQGNLIIGSFNPNVLQNNNLQVNIGPKSGTLTQTRNIEEGSNEVTVSGDLISSQGTLNIGPTTETRTINGTATPDKPVSNIYIVGNNEPINPEIQVSGIETNTRTINRTVSHRERIAYEFSSENKVNLGLTLTGLSGVDETERFGKMSQEDPLFVKIGEESSPSNFNLEIEGSVDKREAVESGNLTSNTLRTVLGGNLQPENVTVNFQGGLRVVNDLGRIELREDAEQSDSFENRKLFTAPRQGKYRLNINNQGSPVDLWSGGYSINTQRYEIEGNESIQLDLNKNDRVSIWAEAEKETLSREKEFTLPERYPLELQSVDVPDNVQTGESFPLKATLRNPDSAIYRLNVYGFKDGEQSVTREIEFQPNVERTVTIGQISFPTEGVHTVSVNEGNQITVNIGNAELRYGQGTVTANAQELSKTGGTLRMDTNNDGEIDCVTSATGKCNMSQSMVKKGENVFEVITEDINNVNYNVEYTLVEGTQDVNIDINNDGTYELKHEGRLDEGETISKTVSLEQGSYSIKPSRPGVTYNYRATWERLGVVSNPEVFFNGQMIIQENESFRGSRTYSIPDVPPGENSLEFRMDGEQLRAKMTWNEQGAGAYPDIYSDGQIACRNQELAIEDTCQLEGIEEDTQSIEFQNLNQGLNYTLTYDAVVIPQTVSVSINGQETTYRSRTPQVIEPWEQELRTTETLKSGTNIINIDPEIVQSISPEVNGQITYESEAVLPTEPSITVTDTQETEILQEDIPDEYLNNNQELSQTYTLKIPKEELEPGNTNINIASSNQGVFEIRTQFRGTTYTNIEFK